MPTSEVASIIPNLEAIHSINPKSMLDVGIGFGRYGYLAREILDYKFDDNGNLQPFQMRIDGIEIFPNYLTNIQRAIYDNIYIGDAFDIINETDYIYDLIFASDVIEHFRKNKAQEFIANALKKCETLYINTPYIYYEQDVTYGNEYENHLSGWNIRDFKELGAKYIFRESIFISAMFTGLNLEFPLAEAQNDNYNENDIGNFLLLLDKYLRTEQFNECLNECEYYIANYPINYTVEITYAYLNIYFNNFDKARKHAEIALKLNPESVEAKEIFQKYVSK